MATTTPDPSGDNAHARKGKTLRAPSLDPRSQSAIDNLGVDDQADLLDVALDAQPGDRDAAGRSFADDVRSDGGNADEDNERR